MDICDRTQAVETAILATSEVTATDCSAVDDAELAKITNLNLRNKGITTLQAGDFAGLTGLTDLNLRNNDLTGLPADVFDGLTNLNLLDLDNNDLASLPADVFDGLTSLPADVFDDLTSLDELILSDNDLSSLPEDVFDLLTQLLILDLQGNSSLTLPMSGDRVLQNLVSLTNYNGAAYTSPARNICSRTSQVQTAILAATPTTDDVCSVVLKSELAEITSLDLSSQSISALRTGDFAGLPGLTYLDLSDNDLPGLAEYVFDDLAALTTLDLSDNVLASLSADVFDDLAALTTLDLSDNVLRGLPQTVFDPLTALTSLDLQNNASLTPPVPEDRVLLPLSALTRYNGADYTQPARTDICSRTDDVETAILAAVPFTVACGQVAEASLAAIASLNLSDQGISALLPGDLAGLTGLNSLSLTFNQLTTLPEDVFAPLTSLTTLELAANNLSSLPADVFDGLSSLTMLSLEINHLTAVPVGVFDDLTSLASLDLGVNRLTALPENVFDDLAALTELYLSDNDLSGLPETVFDSLTALETLDLRGNDPGWTLPEPGQRLLWYLVSLSTYNGEPYVSPNVPEPPGQDFPDDADTKGKLSVGGSVTGNIKDIENTPDTGDAFLVTLKPGTTYRVDLEGEAAMQGTLYDPFLEIYTLNPMLVGSDGGPGRNARVEFEAKIPGEYRIRVSSTSGFTGTYRLSLDEKRVPPRRPRPPRRCPTTRPSS